MKNRQLKRLAENVYLSEDRKSVVIVDQRKLPNSLEVLTLSTAKEMYDAIKTLAVRGAPAIGICAGYSIYCLAQQIETEDFEEFYFQHFIVDNETEEDLDTAVDLILQLIGVIGDFGQK